MNKSKKGFTLIELLAVIIILIIIIFIAINKVNKTSKKTQINAIKASAGSYIKAIEDTIGVDSLTSERLKNIMLIKSELSKYGIKVNGREADSVAVYVEDFDIKDACFEFGKYKVDYKNGKIQEPVKGKCNLIISSDFGFKNKEEVFTANISGTYLVEAWGAQGGDAETAKGGYGAYSSAYVYLDRNDKLYINVGEHGDTFERAVGNGSYNGGGNAGKNVWGSSISKIGDGGGATSVAFASGLLSTLSSNKDNILLVAGGGGGADYWKDGNNVDSQSGGSGGGYVGVTGGNASHTPGTGGTQTTGGTGGGTGSFGQGANGPSSNPGGAGGGGGLYGGGSSRDNAGAGGGSGYINNLKAHDAAMYCFGCSESAIGRIKTIATTCASSEPTANCAKADEGHVKITFISSSSFDTKFSGYTKLNYIESNGSQYIDLGIKPTSTMGIRLKVSSSNISSDNIYLGCRDESNRYWVGNYNSKTYFGYGGSSTQYFNTNITANQPYNIYVNYLNDREYSVSDNVVLSPISTLYNIDNTITVFAGHLVSGYDYKSSIRVYHLDVTEDDKTIASFVPCMDRSGNKGLCDIISGEFKTNIGSGVLAGS